MAVERALRYPCGSAVGGGGEREGRGGGSGEQERKGPAGSVTATRQTAPLWSPPRRPCSSTRRRSTEGGRLRLGGWLPVRGVRQTGRRHRRGRSQSPKGAYRGKSPRRSGTPRPPPSCPLCPPSESVPGLDRPVPCKTSAHRKQSPGSTPRAPHGAVQIVLSTRSSRLPTAAQRSHPRPRHRTSSPDPDRRRCSDRPQRKPRRPKPAARGQPSPPPGAPSRANPRGAPTRRRDHRPRRREEPLDGHRDAGHRHRRRRGRRPSAG